jgi:NADPH-dependent 2,4-dienoyl-CoA reductase/sulfur reductase-like enzyme
VVEALADEPVDYLSVALGESSTYLGSVGIVPPPPEPDAVVAELAARFADGPPLIATSRIVDVEVAERVVAAGAVAAVGMTRALITDPELPAKARSGRVDEIARCIGCNACIAHYHAGTPIACAVNPRTGRERTLSPTEPAANRRRIVVVGAGPAGIAAAAEAGRAGHEVVVFERTGTIGGQIALTGTAPGGERLARTFGWNAERDLRNADVRLGVTATAAEVLELEPAGIVVATGARPYVDPELSLDGVEVLHAWDVLGGAMPSGRRVVVADWGGDPGGLDAAEVLAAADRQVTLVVGSVAVGELVHQYRRNLYLQRLYRAGVELVHHLELESAAEGACRFRNVFAPEQSSVLEADALVLALGRVPEDTLAAELLAAGAAVEEAGDCCSPRSLEEAVLEGTLAARRVVA